MIAGFSSHLAAVIDTAEGRTFVKGMRIDDPEVWTQHREAVLGPHVTPIGPRLRWQIAAGGWDLLGFEYVAGHFADYRVTADLAATAAAMAVLGRLPCPPGLELKDAEVRWGAYLDDPAEGARFAGTTLLHTDWNYSNVLVGEAGARLVDWPWATRGASWIDPCCWIVWLVFAGHEPAAAERWAARVPAWHSAGPGDRPWFATALAAEWTATATRNPNIWTHGLRDAARRWAAYQLRVEPPGTPR
ncbi:aminoglycoside phosphotransferase [Nocardia blacklockiae]|nr:aminoglycoside phosphotransferase [Nocardia blacklockiae]